MTCSRLAVTRAKFCELRHLPLLPPQAACVPRALMLIAAVLTLAATIATLAQEPAADPQQSPLLAARDELVRRANESYQQRDYESALRHLENLLALYQQLYPSEEYPNGCLEVMLTHQNMCGMLKAIGDYERLLAQAKKGLAECKSDSGNFGDSGIRRVTAIMHSYAGAAHSALGNAIAARESYLRAAEIHRHPAEDDREGLRYIMLCDVYDSLGQISSNENCSKAAIEYWKMAITVVEHVSAPDYALERDRRLARCFKALATCYRSLVCYESALNAASVAYDVHVRLFLVSRSEMDRMSVLRSICLLAALHRDMGNTGEAVSLLNIAYHGIINSPDHDSLCPEECDSVLWNLVSLSVAERNDSDFETYRSLLHERVLRRIKHHGETDEKVQSIDSLRSHGAICHVTGEFASAEHYYRQAIDVIKKCDESARHELKKTLQAAIHSDLGHLLDDAGRSADARAEYEQALLLAEELVLCGEYPEGQPLRITIMHNLASHCWLLGEADKAAELYGRAVAISEDIYSAEEIPGAHPRLLQVYSAWSNVLAREGRLDDAEMYLRRSIDYLETCVNRHTHPHGHDELAASWVDLGRLRRARGDFPVARSYFVRALESYEARGASGHREGQLSVALVLAELGRTYREERDCAAARKYHEQSLMIRRRLFPVTQFPDGHASLANALRDLGLTCLLAGEAQEAFTLLAESAQIEHAIGESFFGGGSEAELLNLAARKFQSLGPLLQAAGQAGLAAETVYPHVWRRHGFVPRLIADRQRQLRDAAQQVDRGTYEQYVAVRRDLSQLLLVSLAGDADRQTPRLERIRQLNQTKERLENELTRRLVPLRGDEQLDAAVRRLGENLPRSSVFVDFFAFASEPFDATLPSRANGGITDRIVAFVVSHDQPITLVDLGDPRELTTLISAWNDEIAADAPPVAGIALREKIWDPVAAAFPPNVDTVYLAPDGPLARVAWNALPCSSTNTGVLLERFALATVPYGPFLLDQLQADSGRPQAPGPFLVVADVDYGHAADQEAAPTHGVSQPVWGRLPGTQLELEAINSCFSDYPIIALTGHHATTREVLNQLARARFAHFATHGFFVDDQMGTLLQLAGSVPPSQHLSVNRSRSTVFGRSPFLRSALALAGANGADARDGAGNGSPGDSPLDSGLLTAENVASVDGRQLALVVLSACDTTRGDVADGEGVLGIQNAFHIAGARNVIAGMWKLPDGDTAELMREFYRILAQPSATPLAALRQAQLTMAGQGESAVQMSRGLELRQTVELEAPPLSAQLRTPRGLHRWAGFMLSGPGF